MTEDIRRNQSTETPSSSPQSSQGHQGSPHTETAQKGGEPVTGFSGGGGGGGDATPASTSEPASVEPETNDRFPRIFGLIIILLAFGFVGGWASVAAIDGAVVAQGTVTVDSYRKPVQHLEGGIVQSIYARDGDTVSAGDLLLQLDETQARASYLVSHNQYMADLARLARLEAEDADADEIDWPKELRDSAERNPRAERAMRTEQREFQTRREAREGRISVLRKRIEQLEERISGHQAQRASRLRMVESLEEELESSRRLAERELIPRADLRPVERQLAEAEGEAGELLANIATARVEAGEAELEIIQVRKDFRQEVAAELRQITRDVDALDEELQALQDTLSRKQIRAPVDGEVVNMQVHGERAVIGPGDLVLDLVPADEPLIVEGRVRPQDVDNVNLGQMADVRFTAFSFRSTPVVQGRVIHVSADRIEPDGEEPYFLARVEVSDDEMAKLGEVYIRPGMPADVMIKTGERTPLQYLAKPLTDALARAFTED